MEAAIRAMRQSLQVTKFEDLSVTKVKKHFIILSNLIVFIIKNTQLLTCHMCPSQRLTEHKQII